MTILTETSSQRNNVAESRGEANSLRDRLTIPLWPDTGRILGLSKNSTYLAASRNEIPGLLRFGSRYVVATAPLRKALGLDLEDAA